MAEKRVLLEAFKKKNIFFLITNKATLMSEVCANVILSSYSDISILPKTRLNDLPDVIGEKRRLRTESSLYIIFTERLQLTSNNLRRDTKNMAALTDSEKAVISELSLGASYKTIAAKLAISVETVKSHLKNTYKKLGVRNAPSAVRAALEIGYIGSAFE